MAELIIIAKSSPKYMALMKDKMIEYINTVEKQYGKPIKRKILPYMMVFSFEGTKEEVLKLKEEQAKAMGIGNKVLTKLLGIKISARANLSDKSEIDSIE